jgi:hypothetical protein
MVSGPLRCAGCGGTDFFVISAGVSYSTGTMVEHYRWPERGDEVPEPTLEEVIEEHIHDGGYHVDQSMLEEPSVQAIDGPIKALCSGCLRDLTDEYLVWGRAETLPV